MARQCMATTRTISPFCSASRPVMVEGVCTGESVLCELLKGHDGDHDPRLGGAGGGEHIPTERNEP